MRKDYVKLTACLLTSAMALGSVPVGATTLTAGVTNYTSNVVTTSTLPTAGVSQSLSEVVLTQNDASAKKVAKEAEVTDNDAPTVSAKYANIGIAQVDNYVNIRKKPNENSKVLGKLYDDSAATVLGTKKGWSKVKSGTVEGWIKSEFIVVGNEKLAKKVGRRVATVNTETLKVRAKASKKAEVISLVPGGDDLTVTSESKKGWVAVSVEEGTGYVSKEFVKIDTVFTEAESIAEEKARLKAEEEERQKAIQAAEAAEAAEASQNQQAAPSTNSTSNSGKSSPSTSNRTTTNRTTGRPATTNRKSVSKPANRTTSSPSTSSSHKSNTSSGTGSSQATSGSGSAVANYACQFVGNRYVYGGSSLTNGTDCSGFVMSVYAHFGVSLPHSSAALRGVGRGVSTSALQPGDIICYSGHVAIYIGGGRIVHASNAKDGIKISPNYAYRSVLACRRIF